MRAQLETRVPLTDGRAHRSTGTALFSKTDTRGLCVQKLKGRSFCLLQLALSKGI